MQEKIIEITQKNTLLNLSRGFLKISCGENSHLIPMDEIMCVLISAPDTLVSKNVVNALTEHHATIVYCDQKFLPSSITLPCVGHVHISERIEHQLSASKPLQKNIWKDIIESKITNQANVLGKIHANHPKITQIKIIKNSVLSGDSKNAEGTASRVYFRAVFGDKFRRDRDSGGVNAFLNYGYIILRSAIARKITATGLLPYVGIHHHNRQNAMPLVDDLMEPFRPLVDYYVYEYFMNNGYDLNDTSVPITPDAKRHMASLVVSPVETPLGNTSFHEGVSAYINSFYYSLRDKKNTLSHPDIIRLLS